MLCRGVCRYHQPRTHENMPSRQAAPAAYHACHPRHLHHGRVPPPQVLAHVDLAQARQPPGTRVRMARRRPRHSRREVNGQARGHVDRAARARLLRHGQQMRRLLQRIVRCVLHGLGDADQHRPARRGRRRQRRRSAKPGPVIGRDFAAVVFGKEAGCAAATGARDRVIAGRCTADAGQPGIVKQRTRGGPLAWVAAARAFQLPPGAGGATQKQQRSAPVQAAGDEGTTLV